MLRSEAWETWGTGADHEQFKHKACGGLMPLMSLLPDDLINVFFTIQALAVVAGG